MVIYLIIDPLMSGLRSVAVPYWYRDPEKARKLAMKISEVYGKKLTWEPFLAPDSGRNLYVVCAKRALHIWDDCLPSEERAAYLLLRMAHNATMAREIKENYLKHLNQTCLRLYPK